MRTAAQILALGIPGGLGRPVGLPLRGDQDQERGADGRNAAVGICQFSSRVPSLSRESWGEASRSWWVEEACFEALSLWFIIIICSF